MYVSDVLELIQPQHEPLRLASRKISPWSEEQDFCRPLEQAFGIYILSPSSSLACMSVLARRPVPVGLVAPLGYPMSGSAPRVQHWFSGDAVSLSLHQLRQLWALVTAVAPAPRAVPRECRVTLGVPASFQGQLPVLCGAQGARACLWSRRDHSPPSNLLYGCHAYIPCYIDELSAVELWSLPTLPLQSVV